MTVRAGLGKRRKSFSAAFTQEIDRAVRAKIHGGILATISQGGQARPGGLHGKARAGGFSTTDGDGGKTLVTVHAYTPIPNNTASFA